MLIPVGCLGLIQFFSPDGGCIDNDTIAICCRPIIRRRPNTCIYAKWKLASGVGICHVYLLCNNGVGHNIMVRRNIWYVCSLHISLHHIKILNGCEKLMYFRWTSVDYFS
jgi:hypothetical protein